MNRYAVKAELVSTDPDPIFSDTVAILATTVHVIARTKEDAPYVAFDLLDEAGETVVKLGDVTFEKEL